MLRKSICGFAAGLGLLCMTSVGHANDLTQEEIVPAGQGGEPTGAQPVVSENSQEGAAASEQCVGRDTIRFQLPPPRKCRRLRGKNFVTVSFDVDADGRTQNVEVTEYSKKCFVNVAKKAVRQWRYSCEDSNRNDVEVTITYVIN